MKCIIVIGNRISHVEVFDSVNGLHHRYGDEVEYISQHNGYYRVYLPA